MPFSPIPCLAPRGTVPSGGQALRLACLGASLLLVAGCTAPVRSLATHAVQAPAPNMLYLDVSLPAELTGQPAAHRAAQMLQADLVKRYARAGLHVAVLSDGAASPGSAILHARISQAKPGNRLERFVIGFGAGQARVTVETSLDMVDQHQPAISYTVARTSGYKPGLILPGGIAAGTGDLTHLAIGGGLDIALMGRSSFNHILDKSAQTIVKQTVAYYQRNGWRAAG